MSRWWVGTFGVLVAAAVVAMMSCSGSGSGNEMDCPMGSESCACYGNASCDGSLTCVSKVCVALGSGGGGGASAAGGSSTGSSEGGVACEVNPCLAGEDCCLNTMADAVTWACGTGVDVADPCYMAAGSRIPPSVASCDGPEDCATGEICCGHGTAVSFDYSCMGSADCSGVDVTVLCHDSADCHPDQLCVPDSGSPWSSCQ